MTRSVMITTERTCFRRAKGHNDHRSGATQAGTILPPISKWKTTKAPGRTAVPRPSCFFIYPFGKGSTMKAYRLHHFGGPDGWKLEDLPSPVPGPGQVLIRTRAVSLNFRDLLLCKGQYNPKLRMPVIPVSDGAGEVVATGAGATRFRPGERVAVNFMPGWVDGPPDESKARSALGSETDGMLAEECVVNEEGLVAIPAYLSYEEAATLPCAGVTAWNAVVTSGAVKPGDTVLVQGTGGVSIFALQFARLAGARVIATSSHDEKLKKALELGATDGINYKTTPAWDKKVRELTSGRGADQIIEVGGAGTLAASLRAVRLGGYIALIGVLSGAGEFNPTPILMKAVRVQGIFVGSRAMFEAMNRAIEVNHLRPVVDRVFPFDEAKERSSIWKAAPILARWSFGFRAPSSRNPFVRFAAAARSMRRIRVENARHNRRLSPGHHVGWLKPRPKPARSGGSWEFPSFIRGKRTQPLVRSQPVRS